MTKRNYAHEFMLVFGLAAMVAICFAVSTAALWHQDILRDRIVISGLRVIVAAGRLAASPDDELHMRLLRLLELLEVAPDWAEKAGQV